MTYLKYILGVLIVVGVIGAYYFPQSTQQLGASIAGATFGDAKVALMQMTPATAAATTTSIQNTDSNDRMIKSVDIACGGLTTGGTSVVTFQLKLATTSVANNGLQNNTNLVGAAIVISTSTPDIVISSSTPSIAGNNFFSDRWAAGSYLTALVNSTMAGTACTLGVSYIPT